MWKFAQENPVEFIVCLALVGGTLVGIAQAIFGGGI